MTKDERQKMGKGEVEPKGKKDKTGRGNLQLFRRIWADDESGGLLPGFV